MKRALTAISFCLLLAACGKDTTDPVVQNALTKMHTRMVERIMTHAVTIEYPLLAKATSELNVKIMPVAESYKGNASIALTTTMNSDATDAKNPKADLSLQLIASADIPSDLAPKPDKANLSAVINARAVDRTLSVNFEKMDLTASTFLPEPFTLPPLLASRWYGQTFAELDAMLQKSERGQGRGVQPPIEQILTNALRGVRMTPADLKKFLSQAHIWKGIRMFPGREDIGLIQIEVESDKEKIRDTVRALLTYIQVMSGPSFESQMRTNEELQTMMQSLTKNDAEFMRTMGSAKGILSADKTTYDFRGFDGDIFSEAGEQTAKVEIRHHVNGDFSIRIVDLATKESFEFIKQGADIWLTSADSDLLRGTLTREKADITLMGKEHVVMEASFDIDTLTKENFEISRGVFIFPTKKLTVTVNTLAINLSNSFKDFQMTTKAVGTLDGKQLFTADFEAARTEIPAFTLTKPPYLPFSELQKDFMGALMPSPAFAP